MSPHPVWGRGPWAPTGSPATYRKRRLTVPTVALLGGADAGVRPGMLEVHGNQADDLVGHVVDGAGHYLADDRPDAVVTHAVELFGRAL